MAKLESLATKYAEAVRDGKFVAGPLVKAACERHLRDLERDDIYYDVEEEHRVINFISRLKTDRNKYLVLLPWQHFLVGSLMAWKWTATGKLRFVYAYVETAKGSGKSVIAPAILLYRFMQRLAAKEAPESYFVAARQEQARTPFRHLIHFIASHDDERIRNTFKTTAMNQPSRMSVSDKSIRAFVQALPYKKDAMATSGILIDTVVIEEYHEHPGPDMHDMMIASMKSTPNPLVLTVTNAGVSRTGACWDEHEQAVKVATSEYDNDYYFSFIAAPEPDADHESLITWRKASPGMDTLPSPEEVRRIYTLAKHDVTKINSFKRLYCTSWQRGDDGEYIPMGHWIKHNECLPNKLATPEERRDVPCYIGIDLARRVDLAAVAVAWDFESHVEAEVMAFTPGATIIANSKRDKIDYVKAAELGYLRKSPGALISFTEIARYISDVIAANNVQGAAVDDYKIDELLAELIKNNVPCTRDPKHHGLLIVSHPQNSNAISLNVADASDLPRLMMHRSIEALQEFALNREFKVLRSPLLRRALEGLKFKDDDYGNRRTSKRDSHFRIDALQALIMAVGFVRADRINEIRRPIDHRTIVEWQEQFDAKRVQ